jgi:hypothetical protein
VVESCADYARVAVWPSDLAPDDSNLAALSLLRRTVDVGDTLAEIEPVQHCKLSAQYFFFDSMIQCRNPQDIFEAI